MRALLALLATLLALAPVIARAGEPTVDERLARLRSEQAGLEARADGEERLGLLAALRVGGLLADALAVRLPLDAGRTPDPPVEVEIAGLRLKSDGDPPTLAVGDWRGEAVVAPERLHFTVPRGAFGLDATRSTLATATLALRGDGRVVTFELPFLVLPD